MSPRYSALLFALGAGLLTSCSLTTYGDDACATNADCRAAFGFGATCDGDGLCIAGSGENARCTRTFPIDLFTRPTNYRDVISIGVIVNESDPSDLAAENAIELAVKQVNDLDLGGVGDKIFAVVFCTNEVDSLIDDTATEEEATDALGLFLARDLGIPAIVGPSTSSQAVALYAAVAPLGTLMISPSATSRAVSTLGSSRSNTRRNSPPPQTTIGDRAIASAAARVVGSTQQREVRSPPLRSSASARSINSSSAAR